MGTGHGSYAPIECLNVVVERTAVLAHVLGDGSNASQQILDVMVELDDEQALLVLKSLARGDVESKTLEAYKSPQSVEFRLAASSSQTSRPSGRLKRKAMV